MGEVLKAIDHVHNRHVAIKVLDTEAYRDPEALRRFEREARSAMVLDHPNIARIYGIEHDQQGRPFIVMEYIEGEPLDRFARGGVHVPFSQLVDFVIQVAKGLQSAYRHSIIHRDIKPSNLLVTNNFVVKIIDFGLAKSLWDQSFLTATGMVVGTPRYIPPEQAMGRTVDHRSDIYSLGATFYELVTHQCPFDGDTPMAIMLKHINAPLVPPYMINPQVPGDISEIICRMMAKDPNERYQDYESLLQDLEAAKLHRLSKEQRTRPLQGSDDTAAPTVLLDGLSENNVRGSHAPTTGYLSEGIVHIKPNELPEPPPPSRARIYILSLIALFILTIAVMSALRQTDDAPDRKPWWLALRIREWLEGGRKSESRSVEDVIREDTERIQQTVQRMEGLAVHALEYKRQHNGHLPTVRELVRTGIVQEADATDGWGHPLVISSEEGGKILAAGRDGIERTSDDFVLPLMGGPRIIPPPLSQSDAAILAQEQNGHSPSK
jgi:serine/threonine protein kinase